MRFSSGVHYIVASALLAFASSCLAQQSVIQEKTNTTESLRGVSAVGGGVVWASGTHGTYLRSVDNGNRWEVGQVAGAEDLDFRDVEAFSAEVGYLLSIGPGEKSRIYKTSDGGKNWSLQFTNKAAKGFYDCMAFWDLNHGIAVGDPVDGQFELITTEDGGKSWKAFSSGKLPPSMEGEGAFAASGTCIATAGKSDVWFATGGKVARVFRSKDRGKTWTVAETPIVHGGDSTGIFSIAFRDGKHGVIAGGDYKDVQKGGANLAYSDDGGATWKEAEIAPQWFFSAVAFDARAKQNVWVAGPAGIAYAEDIRAKAWIRQWPVKVNAMSFSPAGDFFAVGPNGTIVHFVRPTLGK